MPNPYKPVRPSLSQLAKVDAGKAWIAGHVVPALQDIGGLCDTELAQRFIDFATKPGDELPLPSIQFSNKLPDCGMQVSTVVDSESIRICSWRTQDVVNFALLWTIIRWSKGNPIDVGTLVPYCLYYQPGQAYVPPNSFPFSSMCAVTKEANGLRYGTYSAWNASTGQVNGLEKNGSNIQVISNQGFIHPSPFWQYICPP